MTQFNHHQKHLNRKQEYDLILLDKEQNIESRHELRWMIDFSIAILNLNLQASALESQIDEYGREQTQNQSLIDQLEIEQEQTHNSMSNAKSLIASAQNTIQALTDEQQTLYQRKRAVIREEICRIEHDLAFVKEEPDSPFTPLPGEQACKPERHKYTSPIYVEQMCGKDGESGLRQKLIQAKIDAHAFTLQCILGESAPKGQAVNCQAIDTNERQLVKTLWDKESTFLEKQRNEVENYRKDLLKHLDAAQGWMEKFINGVEDADRVLAAAQATFLIFNNIPASIASMFGGPIIDLGKSAKRAFDVIKSIKNRAERTQKTIQESRDRLEEWRGKIRKVKQQLAEFDFEKEKQRLAFQRLELDLLGKQEATKREISQLELQNHIANIECQSQNLGLEGRIATLKSEHARQRALIEVAAHQNSSLDFDILEQRKVIERAHLQIANLQKDLERIRIQMDALKKDNLSIQNLRTRADERKNKVLATEGQVTDLANESKQFTTMLGDLSQSQKTAMLAINEEELKFLEESLSTDQSRTKELMTNLERSRELTAKNQELNKKMLEFQQVVQEKTEEERATLLTSASKINDPQEKGRMFQASQETLSRMLKGIPEYVEGKRRWLETANKTRYLMDRRYELITGLIGGNHDAQAIYVRNATQLGDLIDAIANDRFFNEQQIHQDIARIDIPRDSGFVQELALNKTVDFQITPAVIDEKGMDQAGYFQLWNNDKFPTSTNMTLIDMIIAVDLPCKADLSKYYLTHKGHGTRFKPLSEGSTTLRPELVIGPKRIASRFFLHLPSNQKRIDSILNYWKDDFRVRNFPKLKGPVHDSQNNLPLLGVPVIGDYTLTLDSQPQGCSFNQANLTLYIIYAKND